MFHLENFPLLLCHFNFLVSIIEFFLKSLISIINIYSFLFEIVLDPCIFLFHFFIFSINHGFSFLFLYSLSLYLICHFVQMLMPDVNSSNFLIGSNLFGVGDSLGSMFLHTFNLKLFLHNRSFKSSSGFVLYVSKLVFNLHWIIITCKNRAVFSFSTTPESACSCSALLTFIIWRLSQSNTATHTAC